MATMMATDDKDNEDDGDGAMDDGATGDGTTTMTMAMGDDNNEDGDVMATK